MELAERKREESERLKAKLAAVEARLLADGGTPYPECPEYPE